MTIYNATIPNSLSESQRVIQKNFQAIQDQFNQNHILPVSGADLKLGKHRNVCFVEQGGDQVTAAAECALYTKNNGGNPDIFYRNQSNGTVINFTNDGEFYSPLKVEAFLRCDRNGKIFEQFNIDSVTPGGLVAGTTNRRYDDLTINFTNAISTADYLYWFHARYSPQSSLPSGTGIVQREPVFNVYRGATYGTYVTTTSIRIAGFMLNQSTDFPLKVISNNRISSFYLIVYTVQP